MLTGLGGYLFRWWYYFRNGYGLYLSFPLGFTSFITFTYYLLIQNLPTLVTIFPTFIRYAVLACLVVFPTGSILGWLHLKKTRAYTSQVEIDYEANIFNYKITPGIHTEVTWPIWDILIPLFLRLGEKEGILLPEEKDMLKSISEKIKKIRAGELIGAPKIMQSKRG